MDLATLGFSVNSQPLKQGTIDLDKFGREGERTDKRIRTSTEAMGQSFGSLKGLIAGAGAAMAVFGVSVGLTAAIGQARDFNAAIAETSTLIKGTPAELAQLEGAARSLAMAYGGTATGQVEAFYQAISAGVGGVAEASALLETANRLAIGGVTDVTTGVDALTTAVNAYGPGVLTAAQASDALFVAMGAGKTTIGELSASLGQIVPIAAASGVSFDEVTGAIAALTTQGLSTASATTGLRQVLAAVIAPTSQAAKEAERLGLAFDGEALKAQGLQGFLESVIAATDGNQESMATLFGSVEALGAVMSFAGGAGQKFGQIMLDMGNKAGATNAAYTKMADSLDQRWSRVVAAAGDLTLTLGNALLTVLVPAMEAAAAGVGFMAENADVLAIALGVIAVRSIPAAVAGLTTLVTSLGITSAGLIAGGVAATALSVALNAIPIVAVITLLTGLERGFSQSAAAAATYKTAIEGMTGAQESLTTATQTFYDNMTQNNLDALMMSAQRARDSVAAALDAAKAELDAAGWFTRAFGVELYETDRMTAAQQAVSELEAKLFDAEAMLGMAEHTASNFTHRMQETGTAASDAATDVDTLATSLTAASRATYSVIPTMAELTAKYGDQAGAMREVLEAQNALAVADQRASYDAAIKGVSNLASSADAAGTSLRDLDGALFAAGEADTLGNQARAALDLAAALRDAAGGIANMDAPTRTLYERLLEAAQQSAEMAAKIDEASASALTLAGAVVTVESAFDGAIGKAETFVGILQRGLVSVSGMAEQAGAFLANLPGSYVDSGLASQLAGASDGVAASAALIKQREGFRNDAYNDPERDAQGNQRGPDIYRAGYGSNTITDPATGAMIGHVTASTRVSLAQAEADLTRRIGDFQAGILASMVEVVGAEAAAERWASFLPSQQAALTDIAYNYGSLPSRITSTVATGTNAQIGEAIVGLGADNGGINRDRRYQEAGIFAGNIGLPEEAARQAQAVTQQAAEDQRALTEAQRAGQSVVRGLMTDEQLVGVERERLNGLVAKGALAQGDADRALAAYAETLRVANPLVQEAAAVQQSVEGPMAAHARQLERLDVLLDAGAISYETYTSAVQGLNAALTGSVLDSIIQGGAPQIEAAELAQAAAAERMDAARQNIGSLSDEIGNALGQADSFADAWSNLGDVFAGTISRMASSLISSGIESLITSAFGLQPGGTSTGLASLLGIPSGSATPIPAIAGTRATGGPVAEDDTYLVGERGPELFTPTSSGSIIPNHALVAPPVATPAPAPSQQSVKVDTDVRVYMDEQGGWQAEVVRISSAVAQRQVATYDDGMTARVKDVQRNPRRR